MSFHDPEFSKYDTVSSTAPDGVVTLEKIIRRDNGEVVTIGFWVSVIVATLVMAVVGFSSGSFLLALTITLPIVIFVVFAVIFFCMTEEMRYSLNRYASETPRLNGHKVSILSRGTVDLGTYFISHSTAKRHDKAVLGLFHADTSNAHDFQVNTKLVMRPFVSKIVETRTPLAGGIWDEAMDFASKAYRFRKSPVGYSSRR